MQHKRSTAWHLQGPSEVSISMPASLFYAALLPLSLLLHIHTLLPSQYRRSSEVINGYKNVDMVGLWVSNQSPANSMCCLENLYNFHPNVNRAHMCTPHITTWWPLPKLNKGYYGLTYLRLGGSSLIASQTGHTSLFEDVKTCTPSVFKRSETFDLHDRNPFCTCFLYSDPSYISWIDPSLSRCSRSWSLLHTNGSTCRCKLNMHVQYHRDMHLVP